MIRKFVFLSLLMMLALAAVRAQTVIINTPSTDVVPEKKVYVEFDFLGHLASYQNGGFQTYIPRVVYGAGKGVEVGLNAAWTKAETPDQPVEVQPNVKWRFYNNEKKGVAMSGGAMMFATVANRTGADNFGMLYSNISKKVSGTYGPRVSVGGYGLVGRANGLGSKGGAMVGVEQPLHKKVSVIADWFSGKNRFGYAAGGFSILPTEKTAVGVSYIVGNEGRRNNGLFTWVGYTF
ncbi:MAG: hypothetical protein U0Y68_26280 [Blastocatellia bacterium]